MRKTIGNDANKYEREWNDEQKSQKINEQKTNRSGISRQEQYKV